VCLVADDQLASEPEVADDIAGRRLGAHYITMVGNLA
jgi:hypothetical protein